MSTAQRTSRDTAAAAPPPSSSSSSSSTAGRAPDYPTATRTPAAIKQLRPKGPLEKPRSATPTATSSFGTSTAENPSEARGTLELGAPLPLPPPSKAKKVAPAVKQFDSRQERSPFLDSAYMEQRAKALKAMRERSTA